MLLTRTLIVVFVALYGVVYSSPHQTHDATNNENGNIALQTPNWDFLGLGSIRNNRVKPHFKASNIHVKPHLKASKSHDKLNVFNLFGMVGCGTKCNRLYLMNYGNYCGIGGSGRPIDDVDRCCQKHDDCYGRVMKRHKKQTLSLYVATYNWHCNHGKPSCSRYQSRGWTLDLCNCDLAIVMCLNEFGCPKRSNKGLCYN